MGQRMLEWSRLVGDIRLQIKKLAQLQRPHASWLEPATLLVEVRKQKLFREWGFKNFSVFSKELPFGRSVASDIIKGRQFIEEHRPELLVSLMTEKNATPGYNELALLRRAERKNIPRRQFERLTKEVFNGGMGRDG